MANEKWINETVNVFSNAPSADGSVNTPNKFDVKLPQPVDLHGTEVAVRNVTFPTSWNPVPARRRHKGAPRWCLVTTRDGSEKTFSDPGKVVLNDLCKWGSDDAQKRSMLFTLANLPYQNANDVVKQMLKQMYAAFPQTVYPKLRFRLVSMDGSRKVTIQDLNVSPSNNRDYSVWVNSTLTKMLHFAQDPNDPLPIKYLVTSGRGRGTLRSKADIIKGTSFLDMPLQCVADGVVDPKNTPNTITKKNAIDLDVSVLTTTSGMPQFQRFHVYSNIIKDRIVGGIYTGLLSTVPNPGLDVRLHMSSYSHDVLIPIHFPTEDTVFKSFKFEVRDDNGDLIDFAWGSTSLELHFKRRRGVKRKWLESV